MKKWNQAAGRRLAADTGVLSVDLRLSLYARKSLYY